MRILHLRSSGGFYGAEAVILNLSRQSCAQQAKAYICCINNEQNPHIELVDYAREYGLEAYSVSCRGLLDRHAVGSIRDLVSQKNIDILHCHDYKSAIFGFLATKNLKIARISTNHLWTHNSLKVRFYELLEGILLNYFDHIIAVSDSVAQETRRFIWNKEKVSVIFNGIDCDNFKGCAGNDFLRKEFNIDEDEIVIGIIGRYAAQKGHKYLFHALEKITKANKALPIKVLVIGHGGLEMQFKKMAKDLDIDDRVIFAGFQKDISRALNTMDVLAMPSLSEGFPIALLEAMAAGIPVIATLVGDIPSLVKDGETGFAVRPRDIEGLAGGITRILEIRKREPMLLKKIVQNAQALVEKQYSAKAMTENYLRIYQKVAGKV